MIRIIHVDEDDLKCGLCQSCLLEAIGSIDDMEFARAAVRGKIMISINCSPIAQGHFCVKHGKLYVQKVADHVNMMANKVEQL
jgi:hypothetical protein